jgi:hypothetical protein
MTAVLVTKALEKAVPLGIDSVFENNALTPTAGVPYQRINVLFARPDNTTLGDEYFREQGILEIILNYPIQTGKAATLARLDLLRAAFKRGTTLTEGAQRVIINRTPEIGQSTVVNDRWMTRISIPWYSES